MVVTGLAAMAMATVVAEGFGLRHGACPRTRGGYKYVCGHWLRM